VPRTTNPRKALAGGVAGTALLLALGVAAVAQMTDSGPTSPAASVARASSQELAAAASPEPQGAPTDTAPPTTAAIPAPAAPTPTAPAAKATPSTTATTRKAPSTTVAPATTPTSAPATTPTTAAKVRSGARVAYTTAGVQSAMAAITQRIPLFKPNDAQLRAFADAVCGQFDQGQTLAQVQATIRQAVTHLQGQSLSDADAAFMVQTVSALRCPGYLP
jgi:hypothetical protein